MKKFSIIIIVLLIISIFVQLTYFNFQKNNAIKKNEIAENIIKRMEDYENTNEVENTVTSTITYLDDFISKYIKDKKNFDNSENVLINEESKETINNNITSVINKFADQDAKTLTESLKWKSYDDIKEYYDTNKSKFDDMKIYSKDDLVEISKQTKKLSWTGNDLKCLSRIVDRDTISKDNNYEYCTVVLKYSKDDWSIKIKLAVAFDENSNQKYKIME